MSRSAGHCPSHSSGITCYGHECLYSGVNQHPVAEQALKTDWVMDQILKR